MVAAAALMVAAVGCGGEETSRPPLMGAVAVTGGGNHSCALLNDGTAKCWGFAAEGQLGDGEDPPAALHTVPVAVKGLTGIKAIAAGPEHTCALINDGSIRCWGDNVFGEIGNGAIIGQLPGSAAAMEWVLVPLPVPGIGGAAKTIVTAAALDSGSGAFTCAVLEAGSVQCWGENFFEALGSGSVVAPTVVPGLTDISAVAIGQSFGCALTTGATVLCWGTLAVAQTSASKSGFSATPVVVGGLTGIVALAAGSFHVCALAGDGTVQCWGDYNSGGGNQSATPVPIPAVNGAKAISANDFQTCVIRGDRTVACWGLFTGTAEKPTVIAGVAQATQISVGSNHACAVVADGGVKCWGSNQWGELGDGETNHSNGIKPYENAKTVIGDLTATH